MTHRSASPDTTTARVPFGTRAVRRVLGADPADLAAAGHRADPVLAALAGPVMFAAMRLDQLDAQIARDAARLARDVARLGDDADAHLQFGWAHLADSVQRLAADRRFLDMWHEALNAAMHTYTQARTTHAPTTATTAGEDTEGAASAPT
ncbi:hypothetical protein [Yinghuangia sp. YIM S09857]|uniref:hypothetical protein n=1 Tax=Yinghuangia sp. YIM S09857 TaxID=3436929 RepID=UPI003F53801D